MANAVWGKVPLSIENLVLLLEARISGHSAKLSSIEWPQLPGDITPALTATLAEAENTFAAAKDLRSLLTAYAHRVHQPRPTVADVARAQRSSSQAIATRYSAELVSAIEVAMSVDATLADQEASADQLEAAIDAAASSIDAALQSDIAADYANQLRRRLASELDRRRPGETSRSAGRQIAAQRSQ